MKKVSRERRYVTFLVVYILVLLIVAPGVEARAQGRGAPAPQQAPAKLQGVIIRLGSDQTLGKVSVELRGGPQPATTITESDGRFYFTNVKPGTYRLHAKRDGFVPAEYAQQWINGPGQPVIVESGANLNNLTMYMMAAGNITGRITDSVGNPIPNAQISALRVTYQGLRRVLETVQEARANELGEYRLFWMTPGRYYLAALATNNGVNAGGFAVAFGAAGTAGTNVQQRNVLGASAYNLAQSGNLTRPIFYPSVASVDSALAIEVSSGGEIRDADIRLAPVQTFHVCGVLTVFGDFPPAPAKEPPRNNNGVQILTGPADTQAPAALRRDDICAGVTGRPIPAVADAPARNGNVDGQVTAAVRLAPTGTTANISNVGINDYTATVDPSNGRFVFRNVQAGAYELFTTYNGLNGRIEIEVRDSDIENANLTLAPGFDLQVRMLAERGPSGEAPPVAQLRPYLGDDPPSPRDAFLGEASPDGMTTIKNLVPDNYRFYLEPLLNSVIAPSRAIPPALQDVYVKSVLFGQSDALNAPLHYTGQTETTLDIILGSNPGALEGQVLDAKGMPARGAVVTLLPNVPAQNRVFRMDMFRSVVSDTEGRFRIRGIPPGDYKIFAWAGLERDAWMDPDLQRAYESRAVILKVEERSAVTVELRVIVPGL